MQNSWTPPRNMLTHIILDQPPTRTPLINVLISTTQINKKQLGRIVHQWQTQAPTVQSKKPCSLLRIQKQLPEQPLGPKTDPTKNPFKKTIVLGHRQSCIHHLLDHQPKIPCIILNASVRNLVHQSVKSACKETAQQWFPFSRHSPRRHTVIFTWLQCFIYLRQLRRQILYIGIHHCCIITCTILRIIFLRFFCDKRICCAQARGQALKRKQ